MLRTIKAEYRHGHIQLDEGDIIPENTTVFISFSENSDDDILLQASETSLNKIWDNSEDDIYE